MVRLGLQSLQKQVIFYLIWYFFIGYFNCVILDIVLYESVQHPTLGLCNIVLADHCRTACFNRLSYGNCRFFKYSLLLESELNVLFKFINKFLSVTKNFCIEVRPFRIAELE